MTEAPVPPVARLVPDSDPAALQISADRWLIAAVLLSVVLVAIVLAQRFAHPSPGFVPLADPGREIGWRVGEIARDASDGGVPASWQGLIVTEACSLSPQQRAERCVALASRWLVDSPILLSSHREQQDFIRSQQALLALTQDAPLGTPPRVLLRAQDAHGIQGAQGPNANTAAGTGVQEIIVTLRPGHLLHLSERAAIVLAAAVLVFTMGCAMLAYVRRNREVWLAFGMCAGYFLFMVARLWYTSRTWAQPEWQWHAALWLFKTGVLMCGLCATVVVWNLRLRERWRALMLAALGLMALVVLAHTAGLIDSVAWGYRYPLFIPLLLILLAGLSAWWRDRRLGPSAQLRNRFFTRVIAFGFSPLIVVMTLWTMRPDLPQIGFVQNFAVASAAIPMALLVSQSSHYQLQSFWWRLWLVLMVAVPGVMGAGLLAFSLNLPASIALILALSLTGTIIFALRRWLARRLLGSAGTIEEHLPQLMDLQRLQGAELQQAWRALMGQAFEPHEILARPPGLDTPPQTAIHANGDELHVPVPGHPQDAGLVLRGAARFTRSFTELDRRLAASLYSLAEQNLQARESFVQGAIHERRRIAADLHDDIGGRLLHLANATGSEGQYARHTLEDLRTITRGLSAQARTLAELCADVQFQLAQRADRAGLDFDWQVALGSQAAQTIGSRQGTVLASICSELLRNAMQHTGVQRVQFTLEVRGNQFVLACSNDGAATDPAHWKPGLGTTSIRRRVHDLNGRCEWLARQRTWGRSDSPGGPGSGGVSFRAQWPVASWMASETGSFEASELARIPQN